MSSTDEPFQGGASIRAASRLGAPPAQKTAMWRRLRPSTPLASTATRSGLRRGASPPASPSSPPPPTRGYLGITVSAFSLLSLDPPLALICIHAESQLPDAIESSGAFAVTIIEWSPGAARRDLRRAHAATRPSFNDIPHRTLLPARPSSQAGSPGSTAVSKKRTAAATTASLSVASSRRA